MMLGGPYYAARPALVSSTTDPEFVRRLLDTLAHDLGTPRVCIPEPLLVRVRTHAGCIPTPTPGHETRVTQLREAMKERWGEEAEVIGAGVGGVLSCELPYAASRMRKCSCQCSITVNTVAAHAKIMAAPPMLYLTTSKWLA
ncbi:hypothetical protein FOMPIDRAFT_1013224 [Fomitopsis schrenkii]|uniref:Uncharacterized protein n=1 Tax=Fomitopsis schrenkii TaxID=2126942 RepID=S8EJW9_FOMSC|nr:hypothetical protein FOMPIDRAFT_1013224 [Fomitopsis schrenkii]